MNAAAPHIFLVAGEASGDRLGGRLLSGLKALAPDSRFSGIGGPAMEAQGLESLFLIEDLAVMGLVEVLPRLPRLLARLRQAERAILATRPDILVTIDSPDFTLRLARRVKAALPDLKVVHYVAPSVWAWRPERARHMAAFVDTVLCLLPFEPPLMEAAGMAARFVGHPVFADPWPGPEAGAAFRAERGIAPDTPLLAVLPGSRLGEIRRHMTVFGAALAPLAARFPGLEVVVPLAPGVADAVIARAGSWPLRPHFIDPRGRADAAAEALKRTALVAADAAIAASGTVSLELAAADTPMVIAYGLNPLTWHLLRARLRIDTVTLVNLVSESRAVPECLGPDCRPEPIADQATQLLENDAARAAQREAMALTRERLRIVEAFPGEAAARAVLDMTPG